MNESHSPNVNFQLLPQRPFQKYILLHNISQAELIKVNTLGKWLIEHRGAVCGKFVSGAKVLVVVPSVSQRRRVYIELHELTRIDWKLAGKQLSTKTEIHSFIPHSHQNLSCLKNDADYS